MLRTPEPTDPIAVLQMVEQTPPHLSGYTLRTHSLARAVIQHGTTLSVVRQMIPPAGSATGTHAAVPIDQRLDGVRYLNPPEALFQGAWPRNAAARIEALGIPGFHRVARYLGTTRLRTWLERTTGRPDLLHATSPCPVGRDGARLARHWGIRSLYEVRGFPRLSEAVERRQDLDPRGVVGKEAGVIRRHDRAIAISTGIADALVCEGTPPGKIDVLPNGVDGAAFQSRPYDEALARRWSVEDRYVIGCATNVRRLEGLQVLVRAWPEILRQIPDAAFVLVGSGSYLASLRRAIHRAGIEDSFLLVGRLEHQEMPGFYSICETIVLPRIRTPVCQMVTPLKPLEAMAAGVPVVVSDVGGLTEIVEDGQTGLVFRAGDPSSAADAVTRLARDAAGRRDLATAAREWVQRERSWDRLGAQLAEIQRRCL